MPNGWTNLKPKTAGSENMNYTRTMALAGRTCQAEPLRIGERCTEPATEVVEWYPSTLESTTMKRAAFCTGCRRRCMGKTAKESAAIRKAEAGKQTFAFDEVATELEAWAAVARAGDAAKLRAHTKKRGHELAAALGYSLASLLRQVNDQSDAKLCELVTKAVADALKKRSAA